jgi:pimeloyl-ACP methyl ester carboxylesterase
MVYRDDMISVRGRQVRLLRGGSGRPLLYLHDPWSYTWQPVHDYLAARHDVVFPIHPGFEGAGGLEEMDRMEDMVFHYLDLLEVLRLEQPILLGVSLGGWLAAEFAIRHTGMLRALILVDAMGLRVSAAPTTDLFQLTPGQARAALFADPSLALAQTLVPDTPPREALTAMLKARQAFARFAWQFPNNPKLTSYLYRVKAPTLIIWGERDGVLPVSHGQAYQAEIAAAELALLPACAHLPHLERPDALAATVLDYLQRVGATD